MDIINRVAKETLSFMAGYGIPLTPQNYQKFYYTFWYYLNSGKKYTPDDIFQTVRKLEREIDVENLIKQIEEHLDKTEQQFLWAKGQIKQGKMQDEIDRLLVVSDEIISFIEKQKQTIMFLKKQLEKKTVESVQDPLTGLYNRRAFEEDLKRFIRYRQPFVLVLFDLDYFKKVNDTYGHVCGDTLLKEFARVLKNYLAHEVLKYRIGGEEFSIVVADGDIEAGIYLAKKINTVWQNRTHRCNGKQFHNTVSAGVSIYDGSIMDEEEFWRVYEEADRALYEAKNTGRNRVVVFRKEEANVA